MGFWTNLILLVVSFASLHGAAARFNATSNMQATWLPNSYRSTSEDEMYDLMSSLKEEGVSRVYVDVWNQGTVYFSSKTMRALVGDSAVGADHLAWTLKAGNALGIEVYAWFEYGLMPSYGSINNDFARVAESKGWVLGQHSGFYWLDPAIPDCVAFLGGIMKDAIEGYSSLGLKGVQLDDHFATPVELGRSASDMDNAMSTIRSMLPSTTQLSLSPSTLSFSISTYNVDWNAWGKLNYYDEVIPQLYRTTFDSFKTEFDLTVSLLSDVTSSKWTASGVRVDGSGDATPWADVNDMINYCTANDMGAAVWYARGIVETYPSNFQSIWA